MESYLKIIRPSIWCCAMSSHHDIERDNPRCDKLIANLKRTRLYPRKQMPMLRYIAFIRDSCLMRKRRIRAGGITPFEILTASRAKETPPDSAWTDWHKPSWDAVSDSLERILARRENRRELPRAAVGRKRRPWHMKHCIAAYREWNDAFRDNWPPRTEEPRPLI